jgi:threonine synthase
MGLAVDRLVVATNVNDILARTVATGRYSPLGVTATSSPSMDIQISSNFERLLLELAGGDTKRVRSHMSSLGQGGFTLDANEHQSLRRNFSAARVDEAETLDEIRRLYRETKYIADPHTAVGIAGARKLIGVPGGIDPAVPTVMLATAHPAKFPDAVAKAIGHPPPPPPVIEAQRNKAERISRLPADVSVIARFVKERSRVGRPA